MNDLQDMAFDWAVTQPALMGALLFGLGLLYGFQGFRFFRFLLVVTCGLLGAIGGGLLGDTGFAPTNVLALGMGVAGLILGSFWPRAAVYVACAMTWGLFGGYLAQQMGAGPMVVRAFGLVALGLGALFVRLCYRAMQVILTTLQGAALLVLGFVALSNTLVPSIGNTFRAWADSSSCLTPIMLAMAFVTAYSYQSIQHRGDIRSGA